MTIIGWESKYKEILTEFNYSRKDDIQSSKLLDSLLPRKTLTEIKCLIENKIIFIIGAGPSLSSCIPILKKYNKITKIVADGATRAITENGLKSDIVVTDLDGDIATLKRVGRTNAIMVVHAHGDNTEKLHLVKSFKNCVGTTQAKPFENIHNFGGFTDGDRCVFLADYFKAKKIILFGMDFGTTIGEYSKSVVTNKTIKIRKLRRAKKLLEWIAEKSKSDLYSTTKIKGFTKIKLDDIDGIISSKSAF